MPNDDHGHDEEAAAREGDGESRQPVNRGRDLLGMPPLLVLLGALGLFLVGKSQPCRQRTHHAPSQGVYPLARVVGILKVGVVRLEGVYQVGGGVQVSLEEELPFSFFRALEPPFVPEILVIPDRGR